MASSINLLSVPPYCPKCCRTQTLVLSLSNSQFFSSKSFCLLPNIQTQKLRIRKSRSRPVVCASQSNFLRVIQTVWKIGKDGIEAGTNLVPESVPRPIARISVTVATLAVALFVFKSFLSTAFFVLAMMGLIYFTFIALNKDDGPRGGGGGGGVDGGTPSTEDSLEEARRIMEKYK